MVKIHPSVHEAASLSHEAHLSATQCSSCSDPRISGPNVHERRTEGSVQSSPQGAPSPDDDHLQEVTVRGFPFPKSLRVRSRQDYQRLRAASGVIRLRHFHLVVHPSPVPGRPSRLGLIVTRKIGCAVVRNRVKRVCREAFRLAPGWLPLGCDLLVIARPGAEELSPEGVTREWHSATDAVWRKCVPATPPR